VGKNRRWVETPDGFLYGPDLQTTFYKPNQPLTSLQMQIAAKVCGWKSRYCNRCAAGAKSSSAGALFKEPNFILRLVYGQVFWVDEIRISNGKPQYRVAEKHGSPRGYFLGRCDSFRQ